MRSDISADDQRWFQHKISGCVVLHRGKPILINRAGDKVGECDVMRLCDRRSYTVNKAQLDLTPIPLGYLQREDEALFVTRVPTRKWKIGLSTVNVDCRELSFDRLILSTGFTRMVQGDYPSLQECIARGYGTYAFGINWAVRNIHEELGVILYRGKKVGKCERGRVILDRRYVFLTEDLEEVS